MCEWKGQMVVAWVGDLFDDQVGRWGRVHKWVGGCLLLGCTMLGRQGYRLHARCFDCLASCSHRGVESTALALGVGSSLQRMTVICILLTRFSASIAQCVREMPVCISRACTYHATCAAPLHKHASAVKSHPLPNFVFVQLKLCLNV